MATTPTLDPGTRVRFRDEVANPFSVFGFSREDRGTISGPAFGDLVEITWDRFGPMTCNILNLIESHD